LKDKLLINLANVVLDALNDWKIQDNVVTICVLTPQQVILENLLEQLSF
jgi:hypothetical protein